LRVLTPVTTLKEALARVGYFPMLDIPTTHQSPPALAPKDVLTETQKDGLRALRDSYRVALVQWTLNPHGYGTLMCQRGIAECNSWLNMIEEELPPCDDET